METVTAIAVIAILSCISLFRRGVLIFALVYGLTFFEHEGRYRCSQISSLTGRFYVRHGYDASNQANVVGMRYLPVLRQINPKFLA